MVTAVVRLRPESSWFGYDGVCGLLGGGGGRRGRRRQFDHMVEVVGK